MDEDGQALVYELLKEGFTRLLADNVASLIVKTCGAAYVTAEITMLRTGLTLDVPTAPNDELPGKGKVMV